MAEPATTGALNEQQVLLSTLPPSRGQRRLALAIVLVLLAAFCATVPFATVPVGYIREFIPAYATAMFVISSITSALLFVQFSVVHSRALLAVSGGYLFSALRREGLIADELILQLATSLRSLDLFLELTVRTVPRTLTANQVRRGGKHGAEGPELSRIHSSLSTWR